MGPRFKRLSVRDPNNVGQDCTYDALGRDLSCTDTAGAVTSRTYDLAGQVKSQTDAKGKLTSMTYDSRGRRTTLTDRIAAVTAWVYDAAGNELSMTDAEGQATVYTYDNSGRKLTTQWPDHVAGQTPGQANYGIEAAAYDAAGRLLRKTNQLGDTITSTYDLGSRMLSREYRTLANSPSGGTSSVDTFTYDAASRLLTGVKGLYSNTVAQTYDVGGRKASESLTIAGQTYTVGTAYDTAGRVSQLTYPDGSIVARTYDSRNLLSTIAMAGTNIDSRSYDTGGRLASETLGNGLVVTRTYMTGDNLPLAISNSAVGTYTYGWDANKNKTGETITGAMSGYTSTMGFDDQNRLTAWNRSSGDSQAWTLSAVNDWQSFTKNGTAEARTHGPAHEVLTVGAAAIQHDSRGNMTVDEFAIARTYDADGKVSQATVPAGSPRGIPGTHSYQYDALNRRVRKTVDGTTPSDIIFVHTGEQITADYAAGTVAASPTAKYLWGSYIDELVCQAAGSQNIYTHRNQQHSTIAVTDQTGTVIERYAYTSYGEIITLDPTTLVVRTPAPRTRYTYTGREYDHEAGTYHFRSRIYLPSLGSFLSHDVIGYPDGYNTYAGWFALHNTDPRGKDVFGNPVGPTVDDLFKDKKNLDPQGCVRMDLKRFRKWYRDQDVGGITDIQNGIMDGWGCVGLCCVAMNCSKDKGFETQNGKPAPFNPEHMKFKRTCFSGPNARKNAEGGVPCPKDTTPVIFAKQGYDGVLPEGDDIAKTDQIVTIRGSGVFNFVVYADGYYWGMDQGRDSDMPNIEPQIIICKDPPKYDDYPKEVWCKYCKPCPPQQGGK